MAFASDHRNPAAQGRCTRDLAVDVLACPDCGDRLKLIASYRATPSPS
jgi:hypothetical protein